MKWRYRVALLTCSIGAVLHILNRPIGYKGKHAGAKSGEKGGGSYSKEHGKRLKRAAYEEQPVIGLEDCHWPDCLFPQPVCPDCSKVECPEDLICPPGTSLQENQILGCCPACVTSLAYTEPCAGPKELQEVDEVIQYLKWENTGDYPREYLEDTTELACSKVTIGAITLEERVSSVVWEGDGVDRVPLINSKACAKGLSCHIQRYTEKEPEAWEMKSPIPDAPEGGAVDPYPICNIPFTPTSTPFVPPSVDCANSPCLCREMDYQLWLLSGDCSRHEWKGQCTDTGFYTAAQLRQSTDTSNSPHYRWCSDPMGGRIFGQGKRSEKLNCACSRKRWELSQDRPLGLQSFLAGRKDSSLHCTETGSYEELQCDQGRCWCAKPNSGSAVSTALPEELVHLLPCYDRVNPEVSFGTGYLRKCEHRWVTVAKTQAILRAHGVEWKPGKNYACDYDGTFAPVFRDATETRCLKATGEATQYHVANKDASSMNCRCVRDNEADMPGKSGCMANGNYPTLRVSEDGDKEWCSDEQTGWQVSNTVSGRSSGPPCCLDSSEVERVPQWEKRMAMFEFGCRVKGEQDCLDCKQELQKCK